MHTLPSPATKSPQTYNLARQINEAHARCEDALRQGLQHALEAGHLLAQAKAQVGHGGWGDWLAEHVEVSERTARLYLRPHHHRGHLLENGNALPISTRRAAALIAKPKPPGPLPLTAGDLRRQIRMLRGLVNDPETTPDQRVVALCRFAEIEAELAELDSADGAEGAR